MSRQNNSEVLAVVIHAFYVDIFTKIIHSLKGLSVPIKIYVTTTNDHEGDINQLLVSSGFDFYLLTVANRGRDVLPFLMVMREVIRRGHVVVLKLHTKKTSHRNDGDIWLDDILGKLLAKDKVGSFFDLLKGDENIGMIAPAGHIVPMSTYSGSNKKNILRISEKLGFSRSDVMGEVFVAGTMFYASVTALMPMIDLAFSDEDFEIENNQVDGTLAHAIERCFSMSCLSANLRLISSDCLKNDDSQVIEDSYIFADPAGYIEHAPVDGIVSRYLSRFKNLVAKIKNRMLY